MKLRFEETIDPILLPDSEPATGSEPCAFTPPESLMVDQAQGDTGETWQTPIARQRMSFNRTLCEHSRFLLNDAFPIGYTWEYQIARAEIRSMAEALQLDSRAIGSKAGLRADI
jgi:hypothetical protein